MERLSAALEANLTRLQNSFGSTQDCYTRRVKIAGVECAVCQLDGLTSLEKTWELLLKRANCLPGFRMSGPKLFRLLQESSDFLTEKDAVEDWDSFIQKLTAGFALILLEGCDKAIALSAQEMPHRAVGVPNSEGNVKGSQEGFTELVRVNVGLVRRLIRTQGLCVEYFQLGKHTRTETALLYHGKIAPPQLVAEIKKRLERIKLPFLFDTAYLVPFLRKGPFHLFSGAVSTERPAAAAAKLCEGKVVLLVNGSPFALVVPGFFAENFESLDDYSATAMFASFVRLLKYTAFLLAVLLPGIYVMAVRHLPEILPYQLLTTIAQGEADTPFPIVMEMLVVLVILEIIREAGLRMPKQLGHSVTLVAALIVGDTAVKAGIMSVPVITVAAIAAIAMYVIPSLYEQITMLRFAFVLLCGYGSLIGLAAGLFVMMAMICGDTQGYPYTFPIVPLNRAIWRDGVVRQSWTALAKDAYTLEKTSRQEEP